MKSQCQEILDSMQEGHSLTDSDARRMFGCSRLSARIHDLKRKGHSIIVEKVTENGKTFARYSMIAKVAA